MASECYDQTALMQKLVWVVASHMSCRFCSYFFRGMVTLAGEVTLTYFSLPCQSQGSKFFPFTVNNISEGVYCSGKQTDIRNCCLSNKNEINLQGVSTPLKRGCRKEFAHCSLWRQILSLQCSLLKDGRQIGQWLHFFFFSCKSSDFLKMKIV